MTSTVARTSPIADAITSSVETLRRIPPNRNTAAATRFPTGFRTPADSVAMWLIGIVCELCPNRLADWQRSSFPARMNRVIGLKPMSDRKNATIPRLRPTISTVGVGIGNGWTEIANFWITSEFARMTWVRFLNRLERKD